MLPVDGRRPEQAGVERVPAQGSGDAEDSHRSALDELEVHRERDVVREHETGRLFILERLAVNEGKPQDFYTKTLPQDGRPAQTSIPNNLPRLQPFFGREAELAQIREALDAAGLSE